MAENDWVVGELVRKIQVFVYPRRVRMREFFSDFDHLKCGRCTRPQFQRALANLNYGGLTSEDADLLCEYFTDHGPRVEKPQNINYAKFCDLVDEVYSEGNPDPLQSASSPTSTMMSSFRPRDIEDEDRMMHILHRVASLCKARGVSLKECFIDFANLPLPNPSRQNPKRGGKVTVPQFLRNFPFTKDLSEGDIHTLMDRYTTERGDIHFQAMHNDISEVLSTDAPPFPTSPLVLRQDHTQWSQSELHPIDKLKAKVVEKRVRLYEHFQDFDPLRKGFCTVGQVKTVFTLLNLAKEINKTDFDKLVHGFMREDGLFCYSDFCHAVDRGFTTPGLEKDPMATISMPDPSTTAPARRNTAKMGGERRDQIFYLEDKIRTWVQQRRVLIKPMFTDLDKSKRGFITRNQFARAMGNLGFSLNDIEVGQISSVYCNNGNHMDFNYVDFCKTVDPLDDEVEIATQQAAAPHQGYQPSQYFDSRGRVSPLDKALAAF